MTRVIVVEDEPDIREVVAEALADEGYDVTTATDGASALQLVRELPPDVAIVDLMMPGLDGPAFLRHCRADPRCARMQVIVVTAARGTRLDGLDAQAVVTKPFDLDQLIDVVASLAAS